jgi:hypothetical protein
LKKLRKTEGFPFSRIHPDKTFPELKMSFSKKIAPLVVGTGAIIWSAPALAHAQPFDVPAQPAASGIQSFARQAGWQVLVAQELTRGKRTNAIKGRFETRDALARLLRGTGLNVLSIDGTVVTLGHPAEAPTAHAARAYEASSIIVEGQAQQPGVTRPATAVVDSIAYDDLRTVAGGDGSVVEQLVRLPGIAGVEEGDTPRFISIRGISADLNSTLIDGISVASVGSDGDGSRQVNLQLVPANMSSRNEVYKTFTPELPGDAIGGVVNIITRSAFVKRGSTPRSTATASIPPSRSRRDQCDRGERSSLGEGIKGVVSDRFGTGSPVRHHPDGRISEPHPQFLEILAGHKILFQQCGKDAERPGRSLLERPHRAL